ncbi:MAG: glutaredoxin family protein [Cyanobacteriota bacterium]|nr:glutaredoxin family protein [Cyanobacteriota bacterium]
MSWPPLILYSKPGCHLCEGLWEKLSRIPEVTSLQVRDITQQPEWWQRFQLEIPVLMWVDEHGREGSLPRFAPRAGVPQIRQQLLRYWQGLGRGEPEELGNSANPIQPPHPESTSD